MKRKVCWKVTTKCNQSCKYCFGFADIQELSYDENLIVLDNLMKNGLNHITWTGGEAVLYPELNKLIEVAKQNGIYNKLVTNGIFLSQNDNEYVDNILNNLDEINLSIDSVSNDINIKLGKEENHFEIIKRLLDKIKDTKIKIGINTVVSKVNIEQLEELGEFLNNYKIERWKFLKFMPIRERALENKELFDITENELEKKISKLNHYKNIKKIQYKKQDDVEKDIIILPNGDIVKTNNGVDTKLGNALRDDIIYFKNKKATNKIKTLIALDDKNMVNKVTSAISTLKYVEIVGSTTTGKETLNKIMEKQPTMVFADYNFEEMNILEIMKLSKEKLNEETPLFNIVMNEENRDFVHQANKLGNLNALIRIPNEEQFVDILKDFKEYRYR